MTPRARLNVTAIGFAVAFAALDALDVSHLVHAIAAFALFLVTAMFLRRGWTGWGTVPEATRPRFVEMGICLAATFGALAALHVVRGR